MKIGLTFQVSVTAQGMVFWIARYILVFHFAAINNFDEKTIKIAFRTFVAILTLLCVIFEDLTNNVKFEYLTECQIDENFHPQGLTYVPILASITTLIIIFVQGRIIHLRWKYPLPQQPIQDENNDVYNWKIVLGVCIFTLIVTGVIRTLGYFVPILVLGKLLTILSFYSFLLIAIMALIYSNNRMFVYVKKKIYALNFPSDPEHIIPQHDNFPANSNEEPIDLQDQPSQELNQNRDPSAVPPLHNQTEQSNQNLFYSHAQPQGINTLTDVSV